MTEQRKKPWEKPGSVGGPVPLARQTSSLFQLQVSQIVRAPLVPVVFPDGCLGNEVLTYLTLFLEISDWRSRTSLVPTWITILLNLRLALASTFTFATMSGALAPGKQCTMVAGVSIFTFRSIELPITRALSSGFSVGAWLSGENLFNVLIGTEERCFDPRLCRLTVTQLPCCTGSSRTEQCTRRPELVASKPYSPHILTNLN